VNRNSTYRIDANGRAPFFFALSVFCPPLFFRDKVLSLGPRYSSQHASAANMVPRPVIIDGFPSVSDDTLAHSTVIASRRSLLPSKLHAGLCRHLHKRARVTTLHHTDISLHTDIQPFIVMVTATVWPAFWLPEPVGDSTVDGHCTILIFG
jgi:hypothetical protein